MLCIQGVVYISVTVKALLHRKSSMFLENNQQEIVLGKQENHGTEKKE